MSTFSLPINAATTDAPRQGGLRVEPMAVLVAVYWAAYAGIGLAEIPGFHQFLSRLGALAILLLCFAAWWLLRRSVSLVDRLSVIGVAVAAAAVTLALRHASIQGPLVVSVLTHSIEATITGWIVWLVASRRSSATARRRGMMLVAVLAWAWTLLVRMDGLGGDTAAVFHWRWTPSGEEQFLASSSNAKTSSKSGEAITAPLLESTDADWPAFRGPQRDGAVHGVTMDLDWSDSPPKQIWKRRVGPGWSSIVVVGNRLFTQEQRGEQEAVVCYNAATGDEVWIHLDPARFDEAMGGVGPRATPTFAEGRVYALGATGVLNCLDAATGELKWSRDMKLEGQNATPMWGFCSSPLVVGGKVIVYAGGGGADDGAGKDQKEEAAMPTQATPASSETLLAYDAQSGELAWRAPAGSHSYSSPQLANFAGVQQVLFLDDAALVSVDPESGERLWSLPTNDRRSGPPAIQPHILDDSEFLATFTADAGLLRGKVTHEDEQWQVAVSWKSRDLKPFFSDFVRVGDAIYGFDGSVFCSVDVKTGKRNWKKGRYGSGQVLLVADQPVLVVLSESGEAVLLAANPDKHEELGRFQAIEGKTWNHPTIVRGRLYVRNAEEMACYEL